MHRLGLMFFCLEPGKLLAGSTTRSTTQSKSQNTVIKKDNNRAVDPQPSRQPGWQPWQVLFGTNLVVKVSNPVVTQRHFTLTLSYTEAFCLGMHFDIEKLFDSTEKFHYISAKRFELWGANAPLPSIGNASIGHMKCINIFFQVYKSLFLPLPNSVDLSNPRSPFPILKQFRSFPFRAFPSCRLFLDPIVPSVRRSRGFVRSFRRPFSTKYDFIVPS